MPLFATRERFIYVASLIALGLSALTAGTAAVIAWLQVVRQPMDMVIPPVACAFFVFLLIVLVRQPLWVRGVMRTALVATLLALAAPAWFYTWQASTSAHLLLIDIYPPVSAIFLALMVMVMIYLPPRQAVIAVLCCWIMVAMPVLIYLFTHPQELRTPRGADLLIAYGPVLVLLAVVLPIQRGLTGKIQRLVSEQAKMEIMVNCDPLTGLYNRRFGEHALHDITSRQAGAGVIMFDLDAFKAINDTHGHPVGDLVLQRVAERCKALMGKDACVARWGGEEFLVVTPDIDATALQRLADQIRAGIANLAIQEVPLVTASIGAALRRPEDTMVTLLQRVDQALYRAKQQGGNRVAW